MQTGGCGESPMQYGGCLGYHKRATRQCGGGAKVLNPGAAAWHAEVKALVDASIDPITKKPTLSYKIAMQQASAARKAANPGYKTTKEKYVPPAKTYGHKNKRPVTFSAAERILNQYAIDKQMSLRALRKNIGSCPKKHPERILLPCPDKVLKTVTDSKGRKHRIIVPDVEKLPACAESYKFRPGKNAKGPTGPGIYKIKGLNDLCGPANAAARKKSKLYNKKFIKTKKAT
jgi:hypothetical protein